MHPQSRHWHCLLTVSLFVKKIERKSILYEQLIVWMTTETITIWFSHISRLTSTRNQSFTMLPVLMVNLTTQNLRTINAESNIKTPSAIKSIPTLQIIEPRRKNGLPSLENIISEAAKCTIRFFKRKNQDGLVTTEKSVIWLRESKRHGVIPWTWSKIQV